jgi:1,4-dihydroxy-2-naphthoate polyprenyltransferase
MAFIRLSRPVFLLGGVTLFALGVADAGMLDWGRVALAQLMVTSAQLTAHYVNEHADRDADALVVNRTPFSGGSGVLASGELEPRIAMRAAIVTSITTIISSALLATVAPAAAALGILALTVSWLYSQPPVRLLSTGWGEVAATMTVAGMVPLTGALAMGGTPSPELWWAIATLLPIHFAMLLVFELPDTETDRRAGKRVLAVRWEREATLRVIGVSLAGGMLIAVTGPVPWTALGAVPAVITWVAARGGRWAIATTMAVATLVTSAGGAFVGLID